jgi:hypothetical protein
LFWFAFFFFFFSFSLSFSFTAKKKRRRMRQVGGEGGEKSRDKIQGETFTPMKFIWSEEDLTGGYAGDAQRILIEQQTSISL